MSNALRISHHRGSNLGKVPDLCSFQPGVDSVREFVQRITTRITGLKDEYPVKSYGQLRSDSQNTWVSLLLSDHNEFMLVADKDVRWFLNDAAELSYKKFAHSLHHYAKTAPQIVDEHSSFISFLLFAAVFYSIGRLEVENLLEKVGDSDLANPAYTGQSGLPSCS